jgi:hypothetical protein
MNQEHKKFVHTLLYLFLINAVRENFYEKQNYPNPFNPSTTITFGVPVKANVVLKVFNSLEE